MLVAVTVTVAGWLVAPHTSVAPQKETEGPSKAGTAVPVAAEVSMAVVDGSEEDAPAAEEEAGAAADEETRTVAKEEGPATDRTAEAPPATAGEEDAVAGLDEAAGVAAEAEAALALAATTGIGKRKLTLSNG